MQTRFEPTPDSNKNGFPTISFEEACKKVAKAKSAFDKESTSQSLSKTFDELREHIQSTRLR